MEFFIPPPSEVEIGEGNFDKLAELKGWILEDDFIDLTIKKY